jgi:hypothetical protein
MVGFLCVLTCIVYARYMVVIIDRMDVDFS